MTSSLFSQANLSNAVTIPMNYDEVDAIYDAIEKGQFDDVSVDMAFYDIPLGGIGQIPEEVLEFDLGRKGPRVYSRGLQDELDSRELAFANPLTALGYAAKLPKRQCKYPLAILFTNKKGEHCYLILSSSGDKRLLYISRGDSGSSWPWGFRFLVVRNKPAVQSSER